MRSNGITRALTAILGTWLVVCLAEPVKLHVCTMHGGLAIETGSTPTHLVDGHQHGAHDVTSHSHHTQQSDDGQPRQCTCLGDCNVASQLVALLPAAVSHAALLEAERIGVADSYASPALSTPRFTLPFGNGPPSLLTHFTHA